ncbi:MAG: oxidoreductase [Candidatus Saccharibacteria bacterium]|nr:oxidoreductase [Candidatus Saccharibacteria bacterium]
MTNVVQTFDNISNRLTMYKSVLYGLLSLVVVADILAFLDIIGINPVGLIISAVTLGVSCYVANWIFARLFHATENSESWLITALILACILNPRVSWSFVLLAALCGAIAMASKYLITWRHSHILNPAATGAFVVSVTGLLSANWWIATPNLLPVTIVLALLVLRKQRKFTVFFVFAATALVTMLLVNIGQGQATTDVLRNAFLSWPIVFLGSVMLTEPTTLPSDRYYQLLVAVVVGGIFASQLHFGPVHAAPHTALLIGNLLAAVLVPPFGALLRLTKVSAPAPDTMELVFDKPKGLRFIAGQYMEWTLGHKNADVRGNRRTFSIASAPAEDNIRLTVRTFEKGSSFKRALSQLKPGSKLRIANISGQFILPPTKQKLLLIAGGIGITPFRSMIAQLVATKQHRDIALVYLATTEQHFVYKDLFKQATALGVKTTYVIDRMNDEGLRAAVPDLRERQVMVSGPSGMVNHYSQVLRSMGVKRSAIHKDHFSGY